MFTDVVKDLNRFTILIRIYRLNGLHPLPDLSEDCVARKFTHVEFYESRNFPTFSSIQFNSNFLVSRTGKNYKSVLRTVQ